MTTPCENNKRGNSLTVTAVFKAVKSAIGAFEALSFVTYLTMKSLALMLLARQTPGWLEWRFRFQALFVEFSEEDHQIPLFPMLLKLPLLLRLPPGSPEKKCSRLFVAQLFSNRAIFDSYSPPPSKNIGLYGCSGLPDLKRSLPPAVTRRDSR